MVELEVGLLSDHLHHHRDEITFKIKVYAFCTFLIGEVIPKFHPHAVLIEPYIMRTMAML